VNLWLHTPFKPLDHPHPSGDLTTAQGIRDFLERRGHRVRPVDQPRTRWIYWSPHRWLSACMQWRRVRRRLAAAPPDLWLTYHSYYKAPDLIGPEVSRRHGIPYALFQGMYSTKHRRKMKTWPGFVLNRRALVTADHLFANKRVDQRNLQRIVSPSRITYIRPGIDPSGFPRDPGAGRCWRDRWHAKERPVILTAAMFRPDVKTRGLAWMIRTLGALRERGVDFLLAIAGDGSQRQRLERLAQAHLPGRVRFAGRIPRSEMYAFYSAGDVFAFPGINEALGMVYLEAQCCGLPVVAFDNAGTPEAILRDRTGFLVSFQDGPGFAGAVERLLSNADLRREMGKAAARYVRSRHDLNTNYGVMERVLEEMVGGSLEK
jgi:glycosyltransferase involved in cell wall biosynthesis